MYLTKLGGGAFGNDQQLILDAFVAAAKRVRSLRLNATEPLDLVVVHRDAASREDVMNYLARL